MHYVKDLDKIDLLVLETARGRATDRAAVGAAAKLGWTQQEAWPPGEHLDLSSEQIDATCCLVRDTRYTGPAHSRTGSSRRQLLFGANLLLTTIRLTFRGLE